MPSSPNEATKISIIAPGEKMLGSRNSIGNPNLQSDATPTHPPSLTTQIHDELRKLGFGPYLATPCGVLAPLLSQFEKAPDYHVVPREDNAVGIAAGSRLAGASPVVLMQNSGFGQSVNALASLVVPYGIAMLLFISMRGTGPDTTTENLAMGEMTIPILDGLGIESAYIDRNRIREQLRNAHRAVHDERRCYALLVRPNDFEWKV
ncbi:hypothetical protein ACIBCR_01585 [Micromonospora echinospora]|uniref:hypothetical protein n=1 Tax=Micromonospora echinospora TaxID=1877 RepID=UPI0037A0EEF0